jgi:predicted FMN-binding regulatory protein PaiB
MHVPSYFDEDRIEVPLLLEPEPGPLGRLVGHVARANPLTIARIDGQSTT